LNITLIEPFFTGSHAAWAEGYARRSRHAVEILALGGVRPGEERLDEGDVH